MKEGDLGTMFAGVLAAMASPTTVTTDPPPPVVDNVTSFGKLQFEPVMWGNGVRARTQFPNGYGASVIRGAYSYGGDEGLYELAVILNGSCCYDTPITDDVEGHLTPDDVTRLLGEVAALPSVVTP